MTRYSITVTEEQLTDIMELFSITKPELKARKMPEPKTVGTPAGHTPPHDALAVNYGSTSAELDAWMDARHDKNYKSTYRPVPVFRFVRKTTPMPKWAKRMLASY